MTLGMSYRVVDLGGNQGSRCGRMSRRGRAGTRRPRISRWATVPIPAEAEQIEYLHNITNKGPKTHKSTRSTTASSLGLPKKSLRTEKINQEIETSQA